MDTSATLSCGSKTKSSECLPCMKASCLSTCAILPSFTPMRNLRVSGQANEQLACYPPLGRSSSKLRRFTIIGALPAARAPKQGISARFNTSSRLPQMIQFCISHLQLSVFDSETLLESKHLFLSNCILMLECVHF